MMSMNWVEADMRDGRARPKFVTKDRRIDGEQPHFDGGKDVGKPTARNGEALGMIGGTSCRSLPRPQMAWTMTFER